MSPYAVIFPGQGSQSVGMLGELSANFPIIEAIFAEASDVLGYDLWQLVQQGPAETLDQTVYTQPALLTASCALWRMVCQRGVVASPVAMAGHSLGEYSALVCAEALDFTDAVSLVAARARYMQDAVPVGEGALAVLVGLDEPAVAAVCEQAAEGSILSPANFNSPGQVVVAGEAKAVDRAIAMAKQAGAKLARLLPVSVPSHCALMQPAASRLEAMLATMTFRTPKVPVINNVDVASYDSPEKIRSGLVRQLYSPVRWVETIQACRALGAVRFFECGPNKVLTGLGKRIAAEVEWLPATDLARLTERG